MKNVTFVIVMFVCSIIFNVNAQTQKGAAIEGVVANDEFGSSVSMPDANTVAIGAPFNDGNGNGSGHVQVFEWNGTDWLQKGQDIEGEAVNDWSGTSVSMPDASTVAIGAPLNDGNGSDAGHVRVYEWNGSAWVQKGADIDGEDAGDNFGSVVSMPDANTVAVGAPYNDGNGSDAGHVRVYEWNGSAWVQKGADIDGEAVNNFSGFSVSMPDANTVAIGATHNDGGGTQRGHVRVFVWNGSAWVLKGSAINGEVNFSRSGWSVDMPDANTVAVGTPQSNANGNISGQARIFEWDGNDWVKKGGNIDGAVAGEWFGYAVSMPNANTAAISGYLSDVDASNSGVTRLYEWNGTAWSQLGADIFGEVAEDRSGFSISMPDYNTVAIGSPFNDGAANNAGHVRVFELNQCPVIDVTTTVNNNTITAHQAGATYQWLDCNNNFAVISGADAQNFTVTASGNYAVEITLSGCKDTSACNNVVITSVFENSLEKFIVVYPNPAVNDITIDLSGMESALAGTVITLYDSQGKNVLETTATNAITKLQVAAFSKGLYLLKVHNKDTSIVHRMIIN